MLSKIVSGAQTGVDRGALDAAMELGVPTGGWVPKGRFAEDGVVPDKYVGLTEMPTKDYVKRTEKNVVDSDGTLVLCKGDPEGGTKRTVGFAQKHLKPCLIVDLDHPDHDVIVDWIKAESIAVLNVAGPRGSKAPDAREKTRAVMLAVLSRLRDPADPRRRADTCDDGD